MRGRLRLTSWGKTITAGWGILLSAVLFIHYGPAAETRLFPVTSRYSIVSFEPAERGTIIRFEYEKRRRCTIEAFTWYRKFDHFQMAIAPKKVDGGALNDQWTGRVRSARFFLPMTRDEIENESFATTRHRCHRFWDTVTVVYP